MNSTDVEWSKLDKHLEDFNYEVSAANKDGHCFLTSLQECLLRDHYLNYPLSNIKELVRSDLFENIELYRTWYPGSNQSFIRAIDKYIDKGVYTNNIVDIAVIAAANCLGVNLCIIQCVNDKAILVFQTSTPHSSRDVYLKYHNEHYDAIVFKSPPPRIHSQLLESHPSTTVFPDQGNDPITEFLNPDNVAYLNNLGVKFTHQVVQEEAMKQVKEKRLAQENEHPVPERSNEYGCEIAGNVTDFFTDIGGLEEATQPSISTKYLGQEENKEVPPEYQFEENYSGCEDAVLNNSSAPETSDCNQNEEESEQAGSDLVSPQEDTTASNKANNSDSFFSDSSTQSTSRVKPRKHTKNKMDEERMGKLKVQQVDTIPWDIDGDNIYQVPATEEDYIRKYKDGRNFILKNSNRVGLNGYRKVGNCQGSLICTRTDCPKLTTEGSVNTIDFKRIGNNTFVCNSCGHLVNRVYCGCIKIVEFDKDRGTLTYLHQGNHLCHLKPNLVERRKVLDDLPLPLTGSSKAKKYTQDCFTYYMENDDFDAAFNFAEAVSEADVVDLIKKRKKYPNKSVHRQDLIDSFSHVSRIRKNLLKSDKDRYLIYKWECVEMDGKATYVFKTSECSLKIALKMAGKIKIRNEDSTLKEEPAYFDGMHSRVKFYVTLTLWAFHPAMRMMQILAVMDSTGENAENIEIFFDTFNHALAEYIDEPGYIWNPHLIMVDENGANFEAIERVFGHNFTQEKVVTCQFHFFQCAEKYLVNCSLDERKSFRRWCRKLCDAHTKTMYKKYLDLLRGIAEKYNFIGWLKWWTPRCPHIVPVLRGFGLPKMNLAEVGQSKMKRQRKIWLTEAIFLDMGAFVFQAARYKKFIANREKIIGRGPTLKSRTHREKAEEGRFVDEICEVILHGNLEDETVENAPKPFFPSVKAKHRAPRNLKEGIQEKEQVPKIPPRKNPTRRGRGKNPRYSGQAERNAGASIGIDPRINPNIVPEDVEEKFMKANRVYYVVLKTQNRISKCLGCDAQISPNEKKFPRNLAFVFKMRRKVPPPGGKGAWVLSPDKRNCYFHSEDLGCLRLVYELRNIQIEDIYMSNDNYSRLKEENIQELISREHWDAIRNGRQSVRLTGHL